MGWWEVGLPTEAGTTGVGAAAANETNKEVSMQSVNTVLAMKHFSTLH